MTDLPFRPGQRVEAVMIAEDEEREKRVMEELRALLKKMQALPEAKAVSEDIIAEEIAQYRAGR